MAARSRQAPPDGFDRNAAQVEWILSLPEEVRGRLLTARDIARLLRWAEEFIRSRAPEVLAELEADVYRLAGPLQRALGQEGALLCLRDGIVAAVLPCIRAAPGCAEAAERVISRVTDAAWRAYADSLAAAVRSGELERFRQELTVAKRIQERLLPRTVPEVPGFDIAGRVLPAAEVGGDYWSCKSYPEDGVVTLKLADVTGHGIAAATLVAAVKFISGGYYRASESPAEVMERTNHVLTRETPHDILVTMVYGWLYPASSRLRLVNAGHSPVLHYHAGTTIRIEPTGLALGMIETRYHDVSLSLAPGDLFFTCSDGVTEPMGPDAAGERWVETLLPRLARLHAGEIVEAVLEGALEQYGTPRDDMSVLVVKCTG